MSADATPNPPPPPEPAGYAWRRGRVIPWRELEFRQDPAGGPGGQHVNRNATRVTLSWKPLISPALRADEIERLRTVWESRLTTDGTLRIRCGDERSARRNRERCLEILGNLLRRDLTPPRTRRATRPTRASRERRLSTKRQQSQKKASRRPPRNDD